MSGYNRREILKLLGYTCAAGASLSFSNLVLGAVDARNSLAEPFLSSENFKLLTDLVDVILPKTDTPSASELGVNKFIDYLVKNWMDTSEQENFKQGLKQTELRAKKDYQKNYFDLSAMQKNKLLSTLELEAMQQERKGNNPFEKAASKHAFIKTLKQLTLIGYFTSSEGVAATLKHDPVPGSYQGGMPRKESDRGSYAGTLGDFGSLIEVK